MSKKTEKLQTLKQLINNGINTIRGLSRETGISTQTILKYKNEGLIVLSGENDTAPEEITTPDKNKIDTPNQKITTLEHQNTVPLSKYEELEEEFYSLSLVKIEMEERLTNSEGRNKILEEENKNLKWKIYVLDSEPSESNNELEEARQLNRKYLEEITSLNKQIEQLNEKYKPF